MQMPSVMLANVLQGRFGEATAAELMSLWEDKFITETDFADIAALGMNVVRVPFGWRNLQVLLTAALALQKKLHFKFGVCAM